MKKLLFAMGLGAALAWAFDPDLGSRRRDTLRRKLDQRATKPAGMPVTTAPTTGPSMNSFHAGEPVASVR